MRTLEKRNNARCTEHKGSYKLGPYTFRTKKEIIHKCKYIIQNTEPGHHVDSKFKHFLLDLFSWHHGYQEKLQGNPHAEIKVDWFQSRYSATKCKIFWIKSIGTNTDWVDISYYKACSKTPDNLMPYKRFYTALRVLVNEDILTFRAGRKGGHIDHTGPNEFRHLVKMFIDDYNVNVAELEYRPCPDHPKEQKMFTDIELQKNWIQFHRKHAQLQLISAKENLCKKKSNGQY